MKRYIRSDTKPNKKDGYEYFQIEYEATDNDTGLEEYGDYTALCAKSEHDALTFLTQWAKKRNITYDELTIGPIDYKDIPEMWTIINVDDGIEAYL